jgi:hypothetical protein
MGWSVKLGVISDQCQTMTFMLQTIIYESMYREPTDLEYMLDSTDRAPWQGFFLLDTGHTADCNTVLPPPDMYITHMGLVATPSHAETQNG